MAAAAGITMTADIQTKARELDYVSQFRHNAEGLMNILSVTNKIKKAPGTKMVLYTANVNLNESPGEGEEVQFSKATLTESYTEALTIERYAKSVTIQAIDEKGYDNAVNKTDEEFRNKLLGKITDKLYKGLDKGTLSVSGETLQKALAKGLGAVRNKFKMLDRTAGDIIAFVNINDFYEYLGDQPITTQTMFGMTYVEKYLGYSKIILCSDDEVASGKLYVTAANNLVLNYMDVANSEFTRAGFNYTVDSETGIIGFCVDVDNKTATSETYAILGAAIWPEIADGIAKVTITPGV